MLKKIRIQLTLNDLINIRTGPGRLLTLWVQAGAFNRYEAFKRERRLIVITVPLNKRIFKLLIFFPLHLGGLEIHIALLKS